MNDLNLDIRTYNRAAILKILREKPTTRAALAKETGLTRAALSIITDDLIKEGLVVEGNTAVSTTAGRKGTCIQLDAKSRFAVGISITRKCCEISLTDCFGEIIETKCVNHCENAHLTVQSIAKTVRYLINNNGIDADRFLGGGICSPGPVNSIDGIILNPPGLDMWENYPVVSELSDIFAKPFILERDTNALAIAEKPFVKENGFLYLLADEGLGSSYISGGEVFKGYGGFGCELGHISILAEGKRCRCGNIDCAELYASVPAALKYSDNLGFNFKSWHDVVSAAAENSENALSVIEYEADMLLTPSINAVNLFEPDVIILGGLLAEKSELLAEMLEKKLADRTLTRAYHRVKVRGSKQDFKGYSAPATSAIIDYYFNRGFNI